MGPITVSRAPDGSVVCGILDFYGGWGGPEPVGAPKRAEKRKIQHLKKPKNKNQNQNMEFLIFIFRFPALF